MISSLNNIKSTQIGYFLQHGHDFAKDCGVFNWYDTVRVTE